MKPVALVTGSTRGIGKAIARLLKENGFDVIVLLGPFSEAGHIHVSTGGVYVSRTMAQVKKLVQF